MSETRNLKTDLAAISLLALVAYLAAALVSYDPADPVSRWIPPLDRLYQPDQLVYPQHDEPRNACGWAGATISDFLIANFGFGSVYLLIGLGGLGISVLARGRLESLYLRPLGWLMALAGGSALLHVFAQGIQAVPLVGPAGYLGALVGGLFQTYFGHVGTLIMAGALTLVGLMFWSDYLLFRLTAVAARSFGRVGGTWGRRAAGRLPTLAGARTELADVPGQLATVPRFRARSLSDDLSTRRPVTVESDVEDDVFDFDQDEAESAAEPQTEDAYQPTIPITSRMAARQAPAATPPAKSPVRKSKNRPEPPADSASPADERKQVIAELNQASIGESEPGHFDLPSLELLEPASTVSIEELRDDALRKAAILEKTFQQFGFNIRVVDIETGPVIAQYELELEAGLRLAKITNLADDLAIALRVPSVRIVAPIPGKNTVGIEVPNETRQMVRLRDVMEQGAGRAAKMKIPLFIGDDVRGEPLVVDLASLPHLLIAGRTGTGKSVCLNAIITSILMTRRPDEVRMLMIDPKMVELSGYGSLPHLMHPVVTDMRKAEAILAWAVDKMEDRYALLAKAGVRHITSYNQLGEQELVKRLQPETDDELQSIPLSLPFIVIVADEMADLMMTAGKEVQQHIIRLAQKSRAVGIHLILATQKPTVDVITGLIKSNLPARIAFQVATRTDSQVVLDSNGAEKLLGNGDMLFLWPGTSTLLRGQGTFLTDEEINAVTAAVSTGEQHFVDELVHMKVADPAEGGESAGPGDFQSRDDLYQSAVELVIREGRGSVSLLQRALGIGYGRAGRLIDFMEQDGVVGVYAGQKSREVIMTISQWEQKLAGVDIDADDASDETTSDTERESGGSTAGSTVRRLRLAPEVDDEDADVDIEFDEPDDEDSDEDAGGDDDEDEEYEEDAEDESDWDE